MKARRLIFFFTLVITACVLVWLYGYSVIGKQTALMPPVSGQLTLGSGDVAGMPDPSKLFVINNFNSSETNLLGAFRANQIVAASSIQPLEGYAKLSHESGKTGLAFGVIGNVEMNSPATIGEVRPIHSGGVYKNSGNVEEWKSFFATVGVDKGTGTITNGYGFYMDPWPTSGVNVKNKWGVYINDSSAKNYFGGDVNLKHLSGNPASVQANAFAPSTSVSINGNDVAGEISFSVTTIKTSYQGKLLGVNFASPYLTAPKVILTSANENAPALFPSIFVTATASGFILHAIANTHKFSGVYKWNYIVVQ